MNMRINEKVAVICTYSLDGSVMPRRIRWSGREYEITKLGFHHKYKIGNKLQHVFSVTSFDTFFRLRLNTDNLHWILEEVSDGLTA